MSSKTRLFHLALICCAVLASSAVVHAEKRIALLNIEGARTEGLRETIGRLIRPNKVLSAKTYRNAAKRLRAPKLNPKSVIRVSKYLEADGIIDGTIVARDGGYQLSIRLRSGKNGTITKKIDVKLKKPQLSDKIQRGMRRRLMDAIDELPATGTAGDDWDEEGFGGDDDDDDGGGARGDDDDDDDDEGFSDDEDTGKGRGRNGDKGKADKGKNKIRAGKGRGGKGRGDDDDDDDDDDFGDDDDDDDDDAGDDDDDDDAGDDDDDDDDDAGDDDDDDDDDDRGRKSGGTKTWQDPRMRAAIVMAGASLTKRTLKFTFAPELANPPPGYASGNVPGAFVSGTIYPLAIGDKSSPGKLQADPTKNIGITFLYDQVLKIATNVEDAGAITAVKTTQVRFGVGAVYRMMLGRSESSPSVTFLAGYNRSSFVIDRDMSPVAIDVPNTEYEWIDPGARFRIAVTKEAAVHVEGHALLVMNAGEIQLPEQYGGAKITGADVDAGVEYWISKQFLVRLGARYTALGYSYVGNGVQTDRNNDGAVDVGGALDSYLGGYATVGAAF